MKVLIVEDDDSVMTGLTRLIKASWKIDSIPLEILGVRTLADGLRYASDSNVTILDLALPDSEQEETIRAIDKFRPPVIVMTGSDSADLVASCIKAGAAHVYLKGSVIGFIPMLFESMQKDIVQRAKERVENGVS